MDIGNDLRLTGAAPTEGTRAPGAARPAASSAPGFDALLAEIEALGTGGEPAALDRLDRAVEAAGRAHGQVMDLGRQLEQAFRKELGRR